MKISETGDTIVLGNRLIQAKNIVFLARFDVAFDQDSKNRRLWEVQQLVDGIQVTEYSVWPWGAKVDVYNYQRTVESWEAFLEMYDAKVRRDDHG